MLVHLLRLNKDSLTVNGANILAFQAGIDWDVTRVKGGTAGMLAGGLFRAPAGPLPARPRPRPARST
jgi:uncharacterized protein (AIM24 family)